MNASIDYASQKSHQTLDLWLKSCTRSGKISRNTVAVGIVVIDHLRRKCPVSREEVISAGGEVTGARSGLGKILETYEIPATYLKEVTTRQGHQDGQRLFEQFEWGQTLAALSGGDRDKLLLDLIGILVKHASSWLRRRSLELDLDRRQAPSTWINMLIDSAKGHSSGIVEQHLIGAKLERRFKQSVPNYPAHAADRQTERAGDFSIESLVFHVTATPGRSVLEKCAANIKNGLHPILLIPGEQKYKATVLAQEENIDKDLTVISIEDFVALNIIELATEEGKDFFSVLQEIIHIYNKRLAEVETDLSLQIKVR